MKWVADPRIWPALLTLTAIEIVLGVDNINHQQAWARHLALAFALVTRLALLASIVWVATFTTPIFEAFGRLFSARDVF
jgi:predicted tellurium resistance membrane protein TerC